MPRSLTANNTTGVALAVTRPMWLMEIGFDTILRLASRGADITYNSYTWTGAHFTVDLNRPLPTVSLFNDQLAYGDDFVTAGPGVPVTLIKLYGDEPFSTNDGDEWWIGVMGEGSLDKNIQFSIRPNRPTDAPKYRATWGMGFNHVPPEGTEILTDAGTFVIKRNN